MNGWWLAAQDPGLLAWAGRAVFVGVYLALLAGLIWMPRALRDPGEAGKPWWRSLRFWAALICGAQILVYGLAG